jgi:hypothetical protein
MGTNILDEPAATSLKQKRAYDLSTLEMEAVDFSKTLIPSLLNYNASHPRP